MLVVKWWLASLKAAFYVGVSDKTGIRKPLNPFLGEMWFGSWTDQSGATKLIVEQVSHHPPITACYMSNDTLGIRGEGYTRVEMTFSGYINVRQTGHAVLHIDKEDEDHLIPLPDFSVRGFLSGRLYPEITATYHLISTSGYVTEVQFVGRGLFSGIRNSFSAKMYHCKDSSKSPIYKMQGQWNEKFDIVHVATNTTETHVVDGIPPAPLQTRDLATQDSWESRKAWNGVHSALRAQDMQAIMREKTKLEEAQRKMRQQEKATGKPWQPLFFAQLKDDYELFRRLASFTGWALQPERTKGVWKFDFVKAKDLRQPYRGDLTPLG